MVTGGGDGSRPVSRLATLMQASGAVTGGRRWGWLRLPISGERLFGGRGVRARFGRKEVPGRSRTGGGGDAPTGHAA